MVVAVSCSATSGVLFVACVGEDPPISGGSGDAANPDTAIVTNDVAVAEAGGPCNRAAKFSPRQPLPGSLATAMDEHNARLSQDRLELIFVRRTVAGAFDIFRARRATRDDPFVDASAFTELNTNALEVWPSFGDDGNLIVFGTNREDASPGAMKIYETRRNDSGAWPPPIAVSAVNVTGNDRSPYLGTTEERSTSPAKTTSTSATGTAMARSGRPPRFWA